MFHRLHLLGICAALMGSLASLGCDEPALDNARESSAPQASVEVAFASGDVTDYAFAWTVQGAAEQPMLAGVAASGGVTLRGALQTRVYPSPNEDVWLGLTLTELDEARLEVLGQNVLPNRGASLIGVETILIIPPDADPSTLLLPAETPDVLRHLIPGLMAHVDLVAGRRVSTSESSARTAHGVARVSYERVGQTLTRTIEDYARLDTVLESDRRSPSEIRGEARIDVDASGRLTHVESVELVALPPTEAVLGVVARSEFSLRRTGRTTQRAAPLPGVASWTSVDLDAPPDASSIDRELSRRFAEGMTGEELEAIVSAAGAGLRPSKGALVRVRGLLRGWPETARDLASPYQQAADTRTRAFILDLLLSADTPESLAVVTELLDPSDPDGDLPRLLQHVALVQHPTPELGAFLLELELTAREADDAPLRRASLSAIGSTCDGLTESEPALAERLHAVVVHALDSAEGPLDVEAALAGLANARRPTGRARAMQHRADVDVDVRAQVASSLRDATAADQRDAVFEMLADPHRHVAGSALAVIDFYFDDDAATEELAARVVAGLYRADLAGPLVGVISKRGDDNPLTREALRSLLIRTDDVETRRRLDRLLRGDA